MKPVIATILLSYTIAYAIGYACTPAFAASIKKCVGEDGAVSYTDKQCPNRHNTQSTILSDDDENIKASGLTQSSVSTNRLNSMMPGVQYLCEKRFGQHYLLGNPDIKRAPPITFNGIEDRFIRRESVSITLSGQLKTTTATEKEAPKYLCIAKKAKMLAEWEVKIEKIPSAAFPPSRTALTKSTEH